MRKKIFVLLFLLLAALLAACGGTGDDNGASAEPTAGANTEDTTMDDESMDDDMMDDESMDDESMDDEPMDDESMDDESMDDEPMDDESMDDESMDDDMMDDEPMDDESMDDESMDDDMMDDDMVDEDLSATSTLTLSFSGLEPLGEDFVYEGWIMVDGEPVSTGVFTVDEENMLSRTEFTVHAIELDAATAFILTIEPSPDPDPAPSAVHVLAGDFDGESADLTTGHPAALGVDFSQADGSTYVLAAPSADMEATYSNGIWFNGLTLPELPSGWAYEGWVVGMEGPVSTGVFTDTSAPDSDGAGPAGGPNDFPRAPGQDFVDPPTDLIGYMAVISVEPNPDNSPLPFTLKPLIDMEIEDVGAETPQALSLNDASFPTGMATR